MKGSVYANIVYKINLFSRVYQMSSFDSRGIANRILDIAKEQEIELTMMQLLKLVYISHGWWLSYSDGLALTSDKPQAWQYGPVYPHVYQAFRKFGSNKITSHAIDPETGYAFQANTTEAIDTVLQKVVSSYGKFHAYKLSDMTHKVGTPWHTATKNYGNYAPISDTSIKEHFDGLRQQHN